MSNIQLPQPFGLLFAEKFYTGQSVEGLDLYYDERADCTMLSQHGQNIPFVLSGVSCGRTQTVTETTEEPDDGEDENRAAILAALLTQTLTKVQDESPDEQSEDRIW